MKSFLALLSDQTIANKQGNTQDGGIVFCDYPDTIIRLHFSHFKIVSPERNTCFRDEPHKCDHLYFETSLDETPIS